VQNRAARIALDVSPLRGTPAGVGLYVALLARGLVEAGATPALIGVRRDAAFPDGMPALEAVPLRAGSNQVWTQVSADRDARRTGAELVHYTNAMAPVFRRIPYVVTVHDLSVLRMPRTHPVQRWPVVLANLVAIAGARTIVVPSRFTARELERLGVDLKRVVVIPHAPTLPPADDSRAELILAQYGLERHGYLLFVGTLEPRKNVERLVEAFELVADDYAHLKLVLAGASRWHFGPIGRRIEASRVRERIVLTGYAPTDSLATLVANCAATVYVSLYEGFGMPVLDSMALGSPVVTSNRTATLEAAGGAAELVDPVNVADIARGIRRVLESPDEYRARSLARAGGRTWADVAREHLDAYRFAMSR
jgi:glycosyltransferase involved in cell wall biosynthesis